MAEVSNIIDYYKLLFLKNREKKLVIYSKKSAYPALEIEVETIEKSREDFGVLEMTILKIVKAGVSDVETISNFTGFRNKNRLYTILEDLYGKGQLEINNEKFFITELGLSTIECGHQMTTTKCSLLLCGISGHLLPRKMHSASRTPANKGEIKFGYKYLVEENLTISLESFALEGINKREYNIKDEVEEISDIGEKKPFFLDSEIILYQDENKDIFLEITINNQKINWAINEQNIIDDIFTDIKAKNNVLYEIKKCFNENLFKKVEVNTTNDNILMIYLEYMPDELLKEEFFNQKFLTYIGTFEESNGYEYLPVGLNRVPNATIKSINLKKINDITNGQVLYFTTSDKEILEKAAIYRKMYEIRLEHAKLSGDEKKLGFTNYFNDKFNSLGYSAELVKDVKENYLSQKFKKMISQGVDE